MKSELQLDPFAAELAPVDGHELSEIDGGITSTLVASAVTLDQLVYKYQGCFKLDVQVQPIFP